MSKRCSALVQNSNLPNFCSDGCKRTLTKNKYVDKLNKTELISFTGSAFYKFQDQTYFLKLHKISTKLSMFV